MKPSPKRKLPTKPEAPLTRMIDLMIDYEREIGALNDPSPGGRPNPFRIGGPHEELTKLLVDNVRAITSEMATLRSMVRNVRRLVAITGTLLPDRFLCEIDRELNRACVDEN